MEREGEGGREGESERANEGGNEGGMKGGMEGGKKNDNYAAAPEIQSPFPSSPMGHCHGNERSGSNWQKIVNSSSFR